MPAILYKNIDKQANNVLNDDYDFSRKLKIKTKTSNGVTFTTEGAMSNNKSILAKLSTGFSPAYGINISKLQVTTHGRLCGEAEVDKIVDGLKLTFKAEDGSIKNPAGVKYKQVSKIGAEYSIDKFSSTAEADFSNNSLSGTAVFEYENFLIGAQGSFSIDKSAVADHNVALSYVGKGFHASLLTKKKLEVVSASFDHKISDNVVYAAVLDHDLKAKTQALTVGGRYSPDKETTFCTKVDSDGQLSLAWVQKLRPMVSLTTCARIDVKNIDGETHKLGLGLTLG